MTDTCLDCRYMDEYNPNYDYYCTCEEKEIVDIEDICVSYEDPDEDLLELMNIDQRMLTYAR